MSVDTNSTVSEICHKIMPDGSVTGANPDKPFVPLRNRFHVLQHLEATDTVVESNNQK